MSIEETAKEIILGAVLTLVRDAMDLRALDTFRLLEKRILDLNQRDLIEISRISNKTA